MVNISGMGTTDSFTGAYNKRMEQNRNREAAELYHREKVNKPTAYEYLGATVSISEESKEFMSGIADRKAAQRAAREAISAEMPDNAFANTGDMKHQYLVFSENLYNNGFYDNMSDDEVNQMEGLLHQITAGMDSINCVNLSNNYQGVMSHEAARMDLVSSVNALKYFADKYVAENMKESFEKLINDYEEFNGAKVAIHKNIFDMRNESLNYIAAPNAIRVGEMMQKSQEDMYVSQSIGKVAHSTEEEQKNKQEMQSVFEGLMNGKINKDDLFDKLQATLVNYASGGIKNSAVVTMLKSRNYDAISKMSGYWNSLL